MRMELQSCLTKARVCVLLAVVVAGFLMMSPTANAQLFTIVNNCSYTVYPGIAPAVYQNGGWAMAPGSSVSFTPATRFTGRIWGRIGCNTASPAVCQTGSCGGTGLQCAGTTGHVGTSLAEFNINASGTDWYDVSYVDGLDNPVGIHVSNGSCVSPNTCTRAIVSNCPTQLFNGQECESPCTQTGNPQFCCAGSFGTPQTCIVANWPANDQAYVNDIHNTCPKEYAYAYDDNVGLHTCPTGSAFTITFCPNGSTGSCSMPTTPTGLSATAASSSQINLAWTASTSSCSLTYNVFRSTTATFTPSGSNQVASGVSSTSYSDTGLQPATTYYYVVEATNSGGTSAASNEANATTPTGPPQCFCINAGGPAVSPYLADADFTGGTTINHANTIDLSGVTNPAPMAVYQTARIGSFSYTLPGFTAGSSHTVRLHFAETYFSAAGSRVFSVSINGTTVLTNFDIFKTAGAKNKAVIEQFTEAANSSGQYVIKFTPSVNNSLVSGLQVQ